MRFVIFCLFFLPNILFGSLTDKIESHLQTHAFSGVVLVAKEDQIIFHKFSEAIQIESQFLIGSLSKQITAVCILQAVASGLIDLDAPISRYLPNQHREFAYNTSVHQLLNHTSGIDSHTLPGEKFSYSNLGYDVLGVILETVYGKPYQEIVQNLFNQCQMGKTCVPQSGSICELQKHYPLLVKGNCDSRGRDASNNPSGGIISSAQDLHKWNMSFQKLLEPKQYMSMVMPKTLRNHRYGQIGYGYGVQIVETEGLFEISHSGLIPGYMSTLLYYPDYKVSVVILENRVPNEINSQTFKLHDLIRKEVRHQLSPQQVLSSSHWGGCLMDLEKGEIIWSHNSDRLFLPASTTKVFTTAAALKILGPSFQFQTEIYADPIINGKVQGNLYLVGGADPTLKSDDLKNLAKAVYDAGIRVVKGNVLVDETMLSHCLPKHGEWEDLVMEYSPEQSAMTINNNVITLVVVPNPLGYGPATVEILQEVPYCRCECKVNTAKDLEKPCLTFLRGLENNVFEVIGTIGSCSVQENVAIHNPMEYARQIFLKYLRNLEVQVVECKYDMFQKKKIAERKSLPLLSIMTQMNKISHNLTADLLYKFMFVRKSTDPIVHLMNLMGINKEEYVFYDGSGLSRHNLVSPKDTIKLLSSFVQNEDFIRSLPIVKLQYSNLQEFTFYAKSGSMSGISNLIGYIDLHGKKRLAFAFFVNNSLKSWKETTRALHGQIISILLNSKQ